MRETNELLQTDTRFYKPVLMDALMRLCFVQAYSQTHTHSQTVFKPAVEGWIDDEMENEPLIYCSIH